MGRNERTILFAVAGLVLVAFIMSGIPGTATSDMGNLLIAAGQFVAGNEGFRSTPYGDAGRYSWGYGTEAPGPTGTITEEQAREDMLDHIQQDFWTLSPQVTRNLNINQWIAFLDFSYNEGIGAAQKLLDDLNSGDDTKLEAHMKLYIYSSGTVDSRLVARRNKEWALFTS